MPELPEVETVRRTLEPVIVGKTIAAVAIRCPRIIQNDSPEGFAAKLSGETIRAIDRYGKYLFFIMEEVTLVSHLRMEGKFFVKPAIDPAEKHEHVVFTFTDGTTLRFHDTRKFGTMELVPKGMERDMKAIRAMGLEPFASEFSGRYLAEKNRSSVRPVKSFLLDQNVISGLGNIYADEVLFRARLHPATPVRFLTQGDFNRLADAARTVLQAAVDQGGTTIRSYVSSLGVTGRFQNELQVHQREGEACHVCGAVIVKTRVGGRGTYFCPVCQETRSARTIVIGLTGGIASGKSAVETLFAKHKIPVADADDFYKELSKRGKVLYNEIVAAFGNAIVAPDGEIDRKKLGAIVFADTNARLALNAIAHPHVRQAMEEWLADQRRAEDPIVVASVPLLFESGFDTLCDLTVAVWCPPRIQLARLMKRDGSPRTEALGRIGAQEPLKAKCRKADLVIDNSGTRVELAREFARVLQTIRSLSCR